MLKKITLKSSYGVSFEVDEAIVLMSQRIKCMIEDDRTNNGITLSKVNSAALVNVIKYYKKHSKANADDTELKAWDINFVRNLNKDTFFALDSVSHSFSFPLCSQPIKLLECFLVHVESFDDILQAAKYLNIYELIDVMANLFAVIIKGLTFKEETETSSTSQNFYKTTS